MRHSLLALLLLSCAVPAHSADVFVQNRDSHGLVRAIESANLSPGVTRIRLAPGGIYTLGEVLPGRLGLPVIRGTLQIEGNDAEIRRYSTEAMTLLEVAAGAELSIERLTLAEGSLGAIRNHGKLSLDQVVISDSSAESLRGIVVNHGELLARHCTIAWNRIEGGGRDVGTVINHGRMHLVDSLIADNILSRRHASLAAAGAILNHGVLTLETADILRNQILDDLGGLAFPAVVNLHGGAVDGRMLGLVLDEVPGEREGWSALPAARR
jgi:hypothetical protein